MGNTGYRETGKNSIIIRKGNPLVCSVCNMSFLEQQAFNFCLPAIQVDSGAVSASIRLDEFREACHLGKDHSIHQKMRRMADTAHKWESIVYKRAGACRCLKMVSRAEYHGGVFTAPVPPGHPSYGISDG